jgi:hypothetical protein
MPNALDRPRVAVCPAVYFLLITVHLKAVPNRNYFQSLACDTHNFLNSSLYKGDTELIREK